MPLCSIRWKGERIFVFPILSHSHDNREMLKVAAVVQGVLADAVAGSERLVFIAAVSQVILWTCKPSEAGRDLADKANCRDP